MIHVRENLTNVYKKFTESRKAIQEKLDINNYIENIFKIWA